MMKRSLFWSSSVEGSTKTSSDNEDADKENDKKLPKDPDQAISQMMSTKEEKWKNDSEASQPQQRPVAKSHDCTLTTKVGASSDDFITAATWDEAHLQCCLKLKSLMVTLQQVFDKYPNEWDLQWALPKRETVLVYHNNYTSMDGTTSDSTSTNSSSSSSSSEVDAIIQALKIQQEKQSTTSSKTSWLLWGVASVVKVASNLVLGSGGEDDDDFDVVSPEWIHAPGYDDEEGVGREGSASLPADVVERNSPIVHLDLVRRCLEILQHRMAQELVDPPLLLYRSKKDQQLLYKDEIESSSTITKPSYWIAWCQGETAVDNNDATTTIDDRLAQGLLSTLNDSDADLLLHLLVAMGTARIVSRLDRPDMVALLGSPVNEDKKEVEDLNVIQTRIALLDLEIAQQALEHQMEKWRTRIQDCEKRALTLQKKNPKDRRALVEVRKRKLLQDQLDVSSNQVLNLERTKLALANATHRKTIVDALSDTKDTLAGLRSQTPTMTMEQVDELHETSAEELQHQEELNNAATGGDHVKDILIDEDELLAELAQLMSADVDGSASRDNTDKQAKIKSDGQKKTKSSQVKRVNHSNPAAEATTTQKVAVPSS